MGVPARAVDAVLFADGFESGSMSSWTAVRNVATQEAVVQSGAWGARATSTGMPSYARKTLPASYADVRYSLSANLASQGSNPVTLLALQDAGGAAVLSLYVTPTGKLALRNLTTSTSTVSSLSVSKSVWHQLALVVHANGASSEIEVSFDGSVVAALSGPTSLGTTTAMGRIQMGDAARSRSFTVDFDDVAVEQPVPDTTAPQTPTGLTATTASGYEVGLSWTATTDDVGVTGYDVYRDGLLIASLGSQTEYSDRSVDVATTYGYQVAARDGAGNVSALSETVSVTAPAAPDGDPVIAAAGDIACAPGDANFNQGLGTDQACRQMATSDLLTDGQIARVLPLGDLQYEKGALDAFMTSYDPSWGRVKAITSPLPGNHEYGVAGAADYFEYFGTAAAVPGQGYYSYDLGAWHLIALNSNCAKLPTGGAANGCAEGSPQNDWLEADLAASSAACTLAYFHHPRFSSGEHGNVKMTGAFWTDLYAANADVVLSGHDHSYERFMPVTPAGMPDATRGIRQFVVGSGGKSHYPFPGDKPAISEIRDSTTFGVLKITLHPSSYDWAFVPAAGGTFYDSGSGECH